MGSKFKIWIILACVSLSLFFAVSSSWSQGAAIVRPSKVSKESRELKITPVLAGLRIGDSIEKGIIAIGKPLTTKTLGVGENAPISYKNESSGISFVATQAEGIGIIFVTYRNAGELDGLQVGDSFGNVLAKWGPPASGNNHNALWLTERFRLA
jgi:hypothetical protein